MANISRIPRDIRLRQNHTEFMTWLLQHPGFWEDKLDLYVTWCNWIDQPNSQQEVTAIYASAINLN